MKAGDYYRDLECDSGEGLTIVVIVEATRERVKVRRYHDGRAIVYGRAAFKERFEAVRPSGTSRLAAPLETVEQAIRRGGR